MLGAGLTQHARSAGNLLEELNLEQTLQDLLGPESAGALLKAHTGVVHLGFLAPPEVNPERLEDSLTQAGFSRARACFASEVMARELALLQGCSTPTTILKAFREPDRSGRVRGLEAFLPEVPPEVGRAWIERGVGCHLGIGLQSREDVWRAVDLCRNAGFETPAFLQGQPAVNEAENILVVYADGPQGLRLEFYHSASEASALARAEADG